MAQVLVCDGCKCQEGVKQGLADLCHDCAMELLNKLVTKECLAEVLTDWKPDARPSAPALNGEPKPANLVMTDEARTRQRFNALQIEHGTNAIYLVKLDVPIEKFPAKIMYSGEVVEVLEKAPPTPLGTHFAKRIGG